MNDEYVGQEKPYGDDELMNTLDRELGTRIHRRSQLKRELDKLDAEIAILQPLEQQGLKQWKEKGKDSA